MEVEGAGGAQWQKSDGQVKRFRPSVSTVVYNQLVEDHVANKVNTDELYVGSAVLQGSWFREFHRKCDHNIMVTTRHSAVYVIHSRRDTL